MLYVNITLCESRTLVADVRPTSSGRRVDGGKVASHGGPKRVKPQPRDPPKFDPSTSGTECGVARIVASAPPPPLLLAQHQHSCSSSQDFHTLLVHPLKSVITTLINMNAASLFRQSSRAFSSRTLACASTTSCSRMLATRRNYSTPSEDKPAEGEAPAAPQSEVEKKLATKEAEVVDLTVGSFYLPTRDMHL
jgi:hypothetical protein